MPLLRATKPAHKLNGRSKACGSPDLFCTQHWRL